MAMVFDGDGVVFDTWPTAYMICKTLSRKLTPNLNQKILNLRMRLYWGLPWPVFIPKIFPEIFPKHTTESTPEERKRIEATITKSILEEWKKIEATIMQGQKYKWISGAEETLLKLKEKGIYRGLLTNRVAENLREKFRDFQFEKYFDFIQTWRRPVAPVQRLMLWITKQLDPMHNFHLESPCYKPSPRVFDVTLAHLARQGIDRQSIYFFGDTLTDYQTAQRAKVHFRGVKTGPLSSELLWPMETIVLNSVADVINGMGIAR